MAARIGPGAAGARKKRVARRDFRQNDRNRKKDENRISEGVSGTTTTSGQAVSAVTAAPADAEALNAQAAADDIAGYFSTGPGPADHYHGSEAGGVGQAEQEPDSDIG